MKRIELLVIMAVLAVVVALFAWAIRKTVKRNRNNGLSPVTMAFLLFGVWVRNLAARWKGSLPYGRGSVGSAQFCNVGDGTHGHGKLSMVSDTATASRYLFYEMSGTANECTPALGTNEPLGPSDDLADANALDVPIAIKLLGAIEGTHRAVSDGTVTNNTRICVAKDGTSRATCPAAAAGTFWVVGKAIVPTDNDNGGPVAAGDDFEFIPCFPFQKTY